MQSASCSVLFLPLPRPEGPSLTRHPRLVAGRWGRRTHSRLIFKSGEKKYRITEILVRILRISEHIKQLKLSSSTHGFVRRNVNFKIVFRCSGIRSNDVRRSSIFFFVDGSQPVSALSDEDLRSGRFIATICHQSTMTSFRTF